MGRDPPRGLALAVDVRRAASCGDNDDAGAATPSDRPGPVRTEDFRSSTLPAVEPGFRFDAELEFGYLSDYWQVQGARIFGGDPARGRGKVEADVEKIGQHLAAGACRLGYVIVFEECDWGFEEAFAAEAEVRNGSRVRFIKGYAARRASVID